MNENNRSSFYFFIGGYWMAQRNRDPSSKTEFHLKNEVRNDDQDSQHRDELQQKSIEENRKRKKEEIKNSTIGGF